MLRYCCEIEMCVVVNKIVELKIERSGLFDMSLNSVNAVTVQGTEQMLVSSTRNLIGYWRFQHFDKYKVENISICRYYMNCCIES